MKRIQLPNGTVVSVPDNYGNAPTPNSSLVTGRPEFQHPERRQGIRGPAGQSQNPSNMGLVMPTNKRKPPVLPHMNRKPPAQPANIRKPLVRPQTFQQTQVSGNSLPVPGQGGLPNLASTIARLHSGGQVRRAPYFGESLLNAQF